MPSPSSTTTAHPYTSHVSERTFRINPLRPARQPATDYYAEAAALLRGQQIQVIHFLSSGGPFQPSVVRTIASEMASRHTKGEPTFIVTSSGLSEAPTSITVRLST